MNIASNKVNGIISTLIHNTDAAKMAAAHNNFNIACF
jgi:ribose 5-phosphate isomerase RpiB